MNDKITFYYNPMSRARTAHWMLEEVGAPYETVLLDFKKREHKTPEFLKINPMGKLPTIVHRGTAVTETAAILMYLADAFPKAGLAPGMDDPKRGTYLRWLMFAVGCLEPAIIDRMLKRPSGDRPTALAYGTYEDTMNALEIALTPGPFILGEKFSTADLFICAQIGFGVMTKSLEATPKMQKHLDACTKRPAYLRYMEQTNTYMPK
jgi:glutathione S-transferase